MTWTDACVETLTNLWQSGYSGSLIGVELGLTRSAVIGKVQRLKLPSRTTLVSRRRSGAPRQKPPAKTRPRTRRSRSSPRQVAKARVRQRRPAAPPELGAAPAIPVTVLTLTPVTCNWPQGDPKLAGFHFCGREKPPYTAYCPHHAAIAYR